MRIAMVLSTIAAITNPTNGAERTAICLANALSRRGHETYITNLLNRTVDWDRDFDVLHIINAGGPKGPYLGAIQTARMLGIPVVTSTIYWPIDQQFEEQQKFLQWDSRKTAEYEGTIREWQKQTRLLFFESDVLIPNGIGEQEKIIELMEGDKALLTKYKNVPPFEVIPNAVDWEGEIVPALSTPEPLPEALEKKLADEFVLCVGRLEVRKNQIRLAAAMRMIWETDPDVQLVLVGRATPEYMNAVGGSWAELPILLHDETTPKRVLELMRRCTVYAQPSLLETPGLATMEAAALGRPIVVGVNGLEHECFDKHAYYCEPLVSADIAASIEAALIEARSGENTKKGNERAAHMHGHYTYEQTAGAVDSVYRSLQRGGE